MIFLLECVDSVCWIQSASKSGIRSLFILPFLSNHLLRQPLTEHQARQLCVCHQRAPQWPTVNLPDPFFLSLGTKAPVFTFQYSQSPGTSHLWPTWVWGPVPSSLTRRSRASSHVRSSSCKFCTVFRGVISCSLDLSGLTYLNLNGCRQLNETICRSIRCQSPAVSSNLCYASSSLQFAVLLRCSIQV